MKSNKCRFSAVRENNETIVWVVAQKFMQKGRSMKKRTEKYLLFLVLMGALLGGCVATTVKQATMREEIELPTAIDAKPLVVKKIIVILLRGEKTGSTQVGLVCIPSAQLPWRGGKVTPSGYEGKQLFREDLEIANYPLVGNPDGLFEDPGEWNAEFLVPGLVKEMEANICYPKAVFRNNTPSKGKAFIKAKWQIAPPRRVLEVNGGEELYALASPLDEKWRATTSKGIEYAHRGEKGFVLDVIPSFGGNYGFKSEAMTLLPVFTSGLTDAARFSK